MKNRQITWFLGLLLTTSLLLPAIGNADEVFVFTAQQNNHIRALAASCAACHGTMGNAVVNKSTTSAASNAQEGNAVLAGMDVADFSSKMLVFRDGSRKSTVMHHHAKGLSLDEIKQLAMHFSQQKRLLVVPFSAQALKAEHDPL
ncbi:MAG: class I cytochrome c [Methylotenera sp.]|nr:class I cytochrome c [Methylotenera sp.]